MKPMITPTQLRVMAAVSVMSCTLLFPTTLFAADKTIAELVDAVNGTPDETSREAGKLVKLRNHTKGFCTSGYFTPNPEILKTLAIPFFEQASIKTTARFSLGGTNPNISDKTSGRFMSLKIDGASESLNFVTTNSPVFFASDLDEFFAFQTKIKQGPEGKKWLVDNQPHAKAFFDYVSGLSPSPSFANSRYFGVNSFLFNPANSGASAGSDGQPTQIAGKWIFEPTAGVATLTDAQLASVGDDFLKEELLKRIRTEPARWDLYLQLADKGDNVDDPTVVWPDSRQRVLVGQVVINGERDDDAQVQACDKGIFNPLQLPNGIAASKDPILNARTPAYIESFIRRQ